MLQAIVNATHRFCQTDTDLFSNIYHTALKTYKKPAIRSPLLNIGILFSSIPYSGWNNDLVHMPKHIKDRN